MIESSHMPIPPLNGTKTHPLSKHAKGVLADLAKGPISSFLINPGVRNRLCRENLAEETTGRSGRRQYVITDAGRAAIKSEG
jgi:hypothetical protein